MAKKESITFSTPIAPPPGFEPLKNSEEVAFSHMHNLQKHASSSSKIEAQQSVENNKNSNNFLRRTTRKIVPPKSLYVPQAARVVHSGRRGRPSKAKSVPLSKKHSSLQQEGGTGLDKVSLTPSTRPQEPNTSVLLYAKRQPNLRKHKQLVEETSGVKIGRSAYHEGQNTNSKRKSDDIYVDRNPTNTSHASVSRDHDVQQTRSPISGDRRIKNIGLNNHLCPSIDSSILQQVKNDQNQLALDGPIIKSGSSELDANLNKILDAINDKYGDITRNCPLLESDVMKTFVSLGICKVVQDLQNKQLKDGDDIHILDSYYKVVRDAEKLKVDVQWLHNRLNEIKDAIRSTHEAKHIEAERNKRMKNMAMKKKDLVLRQVELEKLVSEIQDIQDQLNRKTVMVKELNKNLDAEESKFSRFQADSSFTNGLI